ncbi:tetratricopeptide repeat protein [Nonlabens dokdonensis]|jgi:tetratricopeptide (TPR) repeat protein|uniref:Tetratricopeptide repeat protein n=2 Tax=Nonlabens dokdonensis TaxID=328515 RepID=A0ABX5Q1X3_9FLAO|nr:tetratricopeptide repeat protein [Nonlabens dokdonensis]AGC76275.1 putative BatE, tetratricopeptide repeat family [Nonlabens dokdonensis DSW-6]PZX43937.1 tetratricopeptide repeat protein [Nonlabens dokdonensis]
MKKVFTILIVLFVYLSNAQESFEAAAFAKANQAYTSENYDLAIAGYEQILKTGKHSAEVYFNLGNAYYKINAIGPAIYNFEKALQLDPENTDVLNNLKFANQMKIDAIEDNEVANLESNLLDIIQNLSVDEWAYFSILIVLFTILMGILYFYAQTAGKKRLFFILSILGVLMAITSITAAFYAKNSMNDQQYAIIFTEEFTTKEEPKETATSSFTLHEGTKVEVMEEFNSWALIQLTNGNKAWIPLDKIKKL